MNKTSHPSKVEIQELALWQNFSAYRNKSFLSFCFVGTGEAETIASCRPARSLLVGQICIIFGTLIYFPSLHHRQLTGPRDVHARRTLMVSQYEVPPPPFFFRTTIKCQKTELHSYELRKRMFLTCAVRIEKNSHDYQVKSFKK